MTSVLSSLGNALPLARSGSYWFPPQASDVAAGHDFLYDFTLWLCIVFFIAICGATVYFMIKYRKRPGHEAVRTATHNTKLELAWSIGPLFLLMAIFGISTYWYLHMISPPKDEYVQQINVEASQWKWRFDYTANPPLLGKNYRTMNLYLVKGRAYQLVITTPDRDVIHSLFIPAFRMKQDCVPGRYNRLWFRPTLTHIEAGAEGGFDLFCTEYCGKDHSAMVAKVFVYDTEEEAAAGIRADYDPVDESKWPNTPEGMVKLGEFIYQNNCASCHTTDGSSSIGPSFKGIWGKTESFTDGTSAVVNEDYVKESLHDPSKKIVAGYTNAMTPFTFENEKEYQAIYAFLKELAK